MYFIKATLVVIYIAAKTSYISIFIYLLYFFNIINKSIKLVCVNLPLLYKEPPLSKTANNMSLFHKIVTLPSCPGGMIST